MRCCTACAFVAACVAVGLGIAIRASTADAPLAEPPDTPFIRMSDGRVLEYAEAGDRNGTPVLVVHGSLQTGDGICKLTHKVFLEHHARAVCPSLPGCGYSSWTDAPAEEWHRDVAELMQHLAISKFSGTVGWSAGGLMAAVAASGLGERAGERLVLSVPMPPEVSWLGDYSALWLRFLDLLRVSRLPSVVYHYVVVPMLRRNCTELVLKSIGPGEAATIDTLYTEQVCADMLRSVSHNERGITSLWQRLVRSTPIDWESVARGRRTLIVYGENDTTAPPKAALMYHRHIPGSRLFCKRGAGHALTAFSSEQYLGFLWGDEPSGLEEVTEKSN
eukprot:m51a1_g7465 hypothetical protein (333) ;mRNA; r:156759-157963